MADNYYLFPRPHLISRLGAEELKRLQFTGKKSEYIIEMAKRISAGDFSRNSLPAEDGFEAARNKLMQLHGVGQWTADYVALRFLWDPAAFPASDVGLQNTIRAQLGFRQKTTAEDISK